MPSGDLVESWSQCIASAFTEHPGLQLTVAQAARFWGIDPQMIELILDRLVHRAVLIRAADGVFSRVAERIPV